MFFEGDSNVATRTRIRYSLFNRFTYLISLPSHRDIYAIFIIVIVNIVIVFVIIVINSVIIVINSLIIINTVDSTALSASKSA